MLNTKNCDLNY